MLMKATLGSLNNHFLLIAILSDKGDQGVLVTTPEKSPEALQAALMIQKLFQRFPEPRGKEEMKILNEWIESFKGSDFRGSYQIARQALE